MFSVLEKNRFSIYSLSFEYLWCDLAKEILKRFSQSENIELFYKKKFMVLKFCIGARDLTADGKLIK
jgi:hypothetical protein